MAATKILSKCDRKIVIQYIKYNFSFFSFMASFPAPIWTSPMLFRWGFIRYTKSTTQEPNSLSRQVKSSTCHPASLPGSIKNFGGHVQDFGRHDVFVLVNHRRQRRRNRGGGGHWGHVPPPHFSPQSMKCPTSTGVHARPTMYQEGVPRGAIKNRKTWGIAPRAINPGGTIKLLHYRAGFLRSLY